MSKQQDAVTTSVPNTRKSARRRNEIISTDNHVRTDRCACKSEWAEETRGLKESEQLTVGKKKGSHPPKSRGEIQRNYRERLKAKMQGMQEDFETRSQELNELRDENYALKSAHWALEATLDSADDLMGVAFTTSSTEQRRHDLSACEKKEEDAATADGAANAEVEEPQHVIMGLLQSLQAVLDIMLTHAVRPPEQAIRWILQQLLKYFGDSIGQLAFVLFQSRIQYLLSQYQSNPEQREEYLHKLSVLASPRFRLIGSIQAVDPDASLKILVTGWVGENFQEGIMQPLSTTIIQDEEMEAFKQSMDASEHQKARFREIWREFLDIWNDSHDLLNQVTSKMGNCIVRDTPFTPGTACGSSQTSGDISLHTTMKKNLELRAQLRHLHDVNSVQREAVYRLLYSILDTLNPLQFALIASFHPRTPPNVIFLGKTLASL